MLKLKSYAKINLFLDIEGRRQDGYHLIKTVMQSIDLYDEITIDSIAEDKIEIECSNPLIPTDQRNTCWKSADIIKTLYNIKYGVKIRIKKQIPSEAGLAGGSSNCAAVIEGLNKLWSLNMSQDEMLNIGLKVGADVPFCILGGTYLAEGIGEKLSRLNDFKWENILIIKPDFSMSTAFVYKNLLPQDYNSFKDNKIIEFINSGEFYNAAISTSNTLEKVVEKFHPEIKDIINLLLENKAVAARMTGSGSAVLGFFESKQSLEEAYNNIVKEFPHTFKTKTTLKGIEICD
ncbi:MAG: 4-(cytidine 5'-diphospho)-2-C-methyl-D-erythritol kinase [Sedimentibacter saalensis]|uniref:4-(cytidine 5'-diphospho)-2-C-methyl-D-erythritol kinase n=1 Tax=Sedimentibacter saalensis TaxID=130788 RepID=UPI002B1F1539|nr:4-(cytidine 5'-diphospho)-2-C-methyl-D-erythritol kinase [Sedimentibacter saalensis]MEA5093599.1 4-(cytidine 5'-diphospho)-2-C-methyl-D-erythritol kinase [Sedimentibacter saalensis]